MKRTLVVGDVHGCIDELSALLKAAALVPGDQLVLVGDLVAKGPDSQAVVQLARETGAWAVMGNHDRALLRLRWNEPSQKPFSEGQLQVARSLQEKDWAYLDALPLTLSLPEFQVRVVHGGFLPGVPVEAQEEKILLNLRSITPDGQPAFRADEGVPWASLWTGPEHVVFGHDARRGLQQHPFATGLDEGCVYGGRLTGLLLPEWRRVSVKAFRAWAPREIKTADR